MRVSWQLLVGLTVVGCGGAKVEPKPTIHTTYRVIGGVSMGAIGASALGLTNPDKFDGVASLGGPLDAAFFSRMLDGFILSGFCSREALEKILATDPTKLNDPAVIDTCANLGTPMVWEHPNDFNHWHATNNGGTFDRDSYLNIIGDLTLAYGNFFSQSEASPYAPPGIDPEKVRHPAADFCSKPLHVKGLKNAEYNPTGQYDAITFCDGQPTMFFCNSTLESVDFCVDKANIATPLPVSQEDAFAANYCAAKGGAVKVDKSNNALFWLKHAGFRDPCRQATVPVGMMLAFDYNGNGRRDYGEPVLNNGHERFDDVGTDGCANAQENGKGGCGGGGSGDDPNHDDFNADTNPTGTEHDFTWQQGEPFRDDGLDGVPGTGDVGEGNGAFDLSNGRQNLWQRDGRTNFTKLVAAAKARLNMLADGGIRDVFNFGLMARNWFSAVRVARGEDKVGLYRAFTDIPGMTDRQSGNFNPWNHSWARLPKDMLLLYGHEQPTDDELIAGEGDHVGTNSEAASRFQIVFNWVGNMWPSLERPATPSGSAVANGQRIESFESKALAAKWDYGIALPPGYNDPANAQRRYPVTYLLHGYGMEPKNFMATAILTDIYVTDPNVQLRPVIYVFPNGRCCFVNSATGKRDCRNSDDNGTDLDSVPGWERECHSGTFFVNRQGYTATDATRYGDAFFELMDHVDATYRTLAPTEVEAR